jgi:hypothetical protein
MKIPTDRLMAVALACDTSIMIIEATGAGFNSRIVNQALIELRNLRTQSLRSYREQSPSDPEPPR